MDALIQVVCADVKRKSFEMKDVMTVLEPMVKELIAIAIVVVATKRISWKVDLKHSGRVFGSVRLGVSEGVESGGVCVWHSKSSVTGSIAAALPFLEWVYTDTKSVYSFLGDIYPRHVIHTVTQR